MTEHGPRSPRWLGRPRDYPQQAMAAYEKHHDRSLLPWSWITTSCDVEMCLQPECMQVHSPVRIEYPSGVCVYCGDPAGTKDHLLPRGWTGESERRMVAIVPACADCNSRINDAPTPSITERRAKAHASIRRKYAKLLAVPDKSAADLRQLGPTLRSVAVKNNLKRKWLRERLSWPDDDPFYDLRAFQRSGISDPVALGLMAPVDLRRTA